MNDPSNPFHVSTLSSTSTSTIPNSAKSLEPKSGQNQLLSKVGQASSSTPRTEANNRRRFGGLFASFGLGNGTGSPLRPSATDQLGTPIHKHQTPVRRLDGYEEGNQDDVNVSAGISGGVLSFAERMKELTLGSPAKSKGKAREEFSKDQVNNSLDTGLMSLPDELLLHILIQLPPTIFQLHLVSLISTRFFDLSRTPILWLKVFCEAGFDLIDNAQRNGEALEHPPNGEWKGKKWVPHPADQAVVSCQAEEPLSINMYEDGMSEESIPIHYPTLIRSRFTFQKLIEDPDYLPIPRVLTGHREVVYCLAPFNNFIFTGSRDRSIRIYDLLQADKEKSVWVKEDIHEGSVLCMDIDLDDTGKGILVTGSSDTTVGIWKVDLSLLAGSASPMATEVITKIATIQCKSTVLSVIVSPNYIVSAGKDNVINVYSRDTFEISRSLIGHSQPVNSLSMSSDKSKILSGSGDGTWRIWDLESGSVIREGGEGRGIACVEWSGDHAVTGSGDNLVKLYSASSGDLLNTFEGHQELVRSVTVNMSAGVILSASYDKTIRMWNVKTGDLIKIVNEDRSSLVFNLKLLGNKVIAARQDNSIHVLSFGENLPYGDLFAC
ncbi:uncharacterized protein L201_003332 [Kwoniella dendrophila CBS 6074]|uniref:F-box domain-containing protein n=1 Tax=Kwoniella dendrophila CBS 6074 TaxID=1295534 RepID=A0AAX4JSM6_9TREE